MKMVYILWEVVSLLLLSALGPIVLWFLFGGWKFWVTFSEVASWLK